MAHEGAVSNQHSAVSEKEAVSNQHSAISQNQNQHQHQRPFTAKDAENAEGEKGLSGSHGKPGGANSDEQERVQQRAEALALKLAQTYEELTRLLERNPGMKRQMTQGESKQDKVYQKLKQRLKLADMAPRCQWVRQDGTSCGSPQMKQHIYCFAHMQMAAARELMLRLPPPEDANAIQIGIMRIQKSLIEGTISTKIAGLLLYSMQLALTNVGQTTFGKAKDEEMVRETVDEETALSERQRPLTTEGTEDTEEIGASGHRNIGTSENQNLPRMDADERGLKARSRPVEWKPTPDNTEEIGSSGHRNIGTSENQNLPRMDADERGLKVEIRPVEWKPSPDMYRMDTREGREAYEASLRTKIKTSGGREATPPRAAVPQDPQTHAVLG